MYWADTKILSTSTECTYTSVQSNGYLMKWLLFIPHSNFFFFFFSRILFFISSKEKRKNHSLFQTDVQWSSKSLVTKEVIRKKSGGGEKSLSKLYLTNTLLLGVVCCYIIYEVVHYSGFVWRLCDVLFELSPVDERNPKRKTLNRKRNMTSRHKQICQGKEWYCLE